MAGKRSQDTAAMRAAGEVIADKFDILQGINKRIRDSADRAWAGWKGSNSRQFQKVIDRFCEKTDKQLQALNDLRDAMGQSKLSYETTSGDVDAAVKAIAAQLDE